MSYQHSYNNYLGHVLNKSPSKAAYSFSRAERFPTQPTELSPTDLEPCMHANGHSYHPSRLSPTRRLAQPQRISPTHYYQNTYSANSDDAVKRELQKILRKIEERQRPKSKSKSPGRPYHVEQRRNQICDWQKPFSPAKKKKPAPLNSDFQEEMRVFEHPSQNMTITGYYPVGTELSPTGRYASSRIPNVVGAKFRSSPPRIHRTRTGEMGPGQYNWFSEFGS